MESMQAEGLVVHLTRSHDPVEIMAASRALAGLGTKAASVAPILQSQLNDGDAQHAGAAVNGSAGADTDI